MISRIILFLVFFQVFGSAHAHQDFWMIKKYGNVEVRITTGFEYEEIQKTLMIGKLAHELCKDLKYSKKVFLDFKHDYTHTRDSDYFISYDKGQIKDVWNDYEKDKSPIRSNALVIRQVSRKFEVDKTLNLLEYAVLNIESIKSNQKEINYEKNYYQWKINTIDTTLINNLLSNQPTEAISKVNMIKVERPEKEKSEPLSYFLLENKYTCYLDSKSSDTIKLLTVSNIYDIVYSGDSIALVFENYDKFYFIDLTSHKTSQSISIENPSRYYRPYGITSVSDKELEIYYRYFGDDRTLIYNYKNASLNQRINK